MVSPIAFVEVVALVLLPGVAASLAAYPPGGVDLATRVALAPALGYVVVGAVAYGLAVLGILHAPWFFALVAVATAALWYVALSRGGLRERFRAAADGVRADRWGLLAGALVLGGIAVLRLAFLPAFSATTPFRYWGDGLEIADAGGIPDLSVHYGALYPTATSKAFLNGFNAGVSFLVGRSLVAPAILLWIGSVGLAAAAWAAGRELGLRLTAPLFAVLLVANRVLLNTEITADLGVYRAETFGRMVAFAGLAVGVRALRLRERRDVLLAGALLAAAAATHMIPTLMAAAALGSYAAARAFLDRDVRGTAVRLGALAGVTAVLAGGILVLARGDIGFQGAGAPEGYRRLPIRFDPTLYLHRGEITPPASGQRWYVGPGDILRNHVGSALGSPRLLSAVPALRYLIPAGGLVLAAAMMVWFPAPLRPLGLVAIGLAATQVGIELLFSYRYDLFILATFGIRRMSDYSAIPVLLVGLGVLEAGFGLLAGGSPPGRLGRLRAGPVAAVTVIALATPLVATARPEPRDLRAAPGAVAVLDWVRRNTPCDARLLLNQRTTGVFRAATGRVAVLEGMAPYLRPAMLDPVVRLMLDARRFFSEPDGNTAFLADQGVDYVIALREVRLGHPGPVGPVDHDALDRAPSLAPVHRERGWTVYRVTGVSPARPLPDLSGHPGLRCERGPLEA